MEKNKSEEKNSIAINRKKKTKIHFKLKLRRTKSLCQLSRIRYNKIKKNMEKGERRKNSYKQLKKKKKSIEKKD